MPTSVRLDMLSGMRPHRKTVRHFQEPGDCHEFTFSCDRRFPLLTNDDWRKMLARSIDRANERYQFPALRIHPWPKEDAIDHADSLVARSAKPELRSSTHFGFAGSATGRSRWGFFAR